MNRRAFILGLASCVVAPVAAPAMKLMPAALRIRLTNWAMRELEDGTKLITVTVNFR